MSASSVAQIIQKRVKYIQLMEACGFVPGTERHTQVVKNAVSGCIAAVKNNKLIDEDISESIFEAVKLKLCEGWGAKN